MVGRHREHPERLPAEMLLVLFLRMRGEIGARFPLEAGLQKIRAGDGHGSAVDLDHKGMAGTVCKLESEDEVGDEADFVQGSLVRELHAQRYWIAGGNAPIGESGDELGGVDELHVAPGSGDLQRDQENRPRRRLAPKRLLQFGRIEPSQDAAH